MKFYTYITRKQIGVIFANWKRGTVEISKDDISWLYDSCAEVRGYINNYRFEDVLVTVKGAIEMIFEGRHEEATKEIKDAHMLYNAINR